MGENFKRRNEKDRRRQSTPPLSRYSLFGRRRMIRRKEDLKKGGYIDRYSPTLFFFLISIVGLNVLDAFFTMMILDHKGWEVNPVVRSVIDLYGTKFWIWKFMIVSISLVLLCLHSKFRLVREVIIAMSSIYIMVILYQIYILLRL